MLPNNTNQTQTMPQSEVPSGPSISLRPSDIALILISHWPWILLCIILGLGAAKVYLLKSRPVYSRSASILIKDINHGQSLAVDGSGFNDVGLFSKTSDLNNEMFLLKSPEVMKEVIKRLDLQMDYEMEGTLQRSTLYGDGLPFTAKFLDIPDAEACNMTVELVGDSTVMISKFIRSGRELPSANLTLKIGTTVNTPLGRLIINKTPNWFQFSRPIFVTHLSAQTAQKKFAKELLVSSEDGASIINLNLNDYNIQRAEEILYSLIAIYNEQWMADRNQVSISTNEFINERLHIIEGELGNVDTDISDYKSANLIAGDAEAMATAYMGQAQSANTQVTEYNNQLYMARSVRGYLTNESNFNQLLPASQGLGNSGITSQIAQYNQILLRRNNLASASSYDNPIVKDLDNQLASLRSTLVASIDTHINELNVLIRSAQGVVAQSNSHVAASPNQNRYLLSVERQQKVKESLYLYLLQKREENELSQAFTAYNNRVVTPPSGDNTPVSPIARNIYIIGLLVGFLLPVAFLLLREMSNTSVRGRKDLDVLKVPFLGEIPLDNPGSKLSRWWKSVKFRLTTSSRRRNREDKTLHLLVKPNSTTVMNEAFRVVRTNMEFIAGRSNDAHVVMLTSFNPNSGKTFVVSNLGMTVSFNKKRVLLIDLDMRKRSLSALVGKHVMGLSNYLGGYVDDYHGLIKHLDYSNKLDSKDETTKAEVGYYLDVLPAGKIPPNPTELLYEDRLQELITSLRKEYDYIFIDCPPLEIVADATIISRLADMTIFVIRAEALQLIALPDIQKYYDENRLPKMTILLNGTTDAFSRYGYHRYGSRYGYSYTYGHGYGYGYGYTDEGGNKDKSSKEKN